MSINNSLFRPSALKSRQKFNPEGFDLAAAIKATAAKEIAKIEEVKEKIASLPKSKLSYTHLNAFADCQPIELVELDSQAEKELVIREAYRQVFGNAHLMESERVSEAESQLSSGQITVMEFIRQLAKSERYRTLFFDRCTNLRAIELNFKHLLGRAPANHAEISEHINILAEGGFEAEIDSYLDSDEYFQSFGTNIVPFYRGYKTQTGKNLASFTHSFQLLRGASSSDKSIIQHTSPQLQDGLLKDKFTEINPLSTTPPLAPKISPPKEEIDPIFKDFKDLEIRNIGYVEPEWSETNISPKTWLQQYRAREAAATFPAARLSQPVQLNNGASNEEIEIIIRAAYKQVFGNAYLMESQRLLKAESKLKDGQLTVKEFVRELAKSERYQALFFDNCSNVRAIELNFKHLLGRAPDSSDEISEHIVILAEKGFYAEIDSYLDSQEYKQKFGEDTVPYYISYETQIGKSVTGYNRIFQLIKGSCSSDRSIADSIASTKRSQLQQSLLKKANIKKPIVFNPQGFDLAEALGVSSSPKQYVNIPVQISDPYIQAFADAQPVELISETSVENQDLVIEAAYKQVFGNAHLMESERSPQIESQLRSSQITVMEFIRQLAKSDKYRALFFESCTNLQAIELNFKHLLGRAPENYAEISEHIKLLAEKGFEAEIDSYLDSDEYFQSFGTDIVPYYRGYKTQTGKNLASFTHSFQLLRGASSSDKSTFSGTYTKLESNLLSNKVNQIKDFSIAPIVKEISPKVESIATSEKAPKLRELKPEEYPLYTQLSSTQRAIICQQEYKASENSSLVKYIPGSSETNAELVIRAIYKQVLGNAHIMESERLTAAESQLKQGNITVREFVRWLAKSELYQSRFINNCPRYRSHELNFKHLLGRAPDSYQETIYHSNILDSQSYEADIDSYIDSEEYLEAFGDDVVPYYRGYKTQTGKKLLGYTNMFEMVDSISTSDKAGISGNKPRLQERLMSNNPSDIQPINGSQPITDTVELIRKILGIS